VNPSLIYSYISTLHCLQLIVQLTSGCSIFLYSFVYLFNDSPRRQTSAIHVIHARLRFVSLLLPSFILLLIYLVVLLLTGMQYKPFTLFVPV
jgi:hypothetical protein